MKSFECSSKTIQEFVSQVEAALDGRDLGEITKFQLVGQELKVIFTKLGTTELTYKIENLSQGFRAQLSNEKIAFTHRPLKADITAKLAKVMEREGARCDL